MAEIEKGDKVEYAPYHKTENPQAANKAMGVITQVNDKPKKDDPDHKTYTIKNDRTQKESTYGERSITKDLTQDMDE